MLWAITLPFRLVVGLLLLIVAILTFPFIIKDMAKEIEEHETTE